VLSFTAGLGYLALHLSDVFGHTGRLDVLDNDPVHAGMVESAARDHNLSDRINVHRGAVAQVVPSLNGPFDLVLLDAHLPIVAPLYADVTRLLRAGGTLAIADPAAVFAAAAAPGADTRDATLTREFLNRLAGDDQFYSAFQSPPAPVIAVRRR
jgi:predicted O-methyltransferase YrrM